MKYAMRSLRKNPGFSIAMVLTLTLGVGANSAIFSLVYAALLRPLPLFQAGRLAFVSTENRKNNIFGSGVSGREYEEWQPQLHRIFEDFATVSGNHDTTWMTADTAVHLRDRDSSANFFSLLGVFPFAGRTFSAEDETAGHGDVVLLSYDFWQRQFGGDLRAIGQTMRERGGAYASYTVIGILPRAFEFDEATDVWTPQQPLSPFLMDLRSARRLRVVGRLRPEICFAGAQAALQTIAAQEADAHPTSNSGWSISVARLQEHLRANNRMALLLLWAAVGCLLCIACANAANLLMARSSAREREIAVRLALGSSRGQLIRQLLTESGLLALMGGGLGCLTASLLLRLLRTWGSFLLPASTLQDVLRLHADVLDPAVLAFTVLLCVLSVLAFGLAPARSSTRLELHGALQNSSGNRITRSMGTSQVLVAAEIAVVMVLTMSAGLLIRTLVKLNSVDPGFQTHNRITFDVELPRRSATEAVTPIERQRELLRRTQWFEEVETRLQAIPGAETVGASNAFPFQDEGGGWGVKVGERMLPASTSMAHVTPGYFQAVGIPIVEGSNFTAAAYSISGAKALIVNQAMARLLFPGANPVGRHVLAPRCQIASFAETQPSDCVIIGVAQDTRFRIDSPAPPTFYYALHQDIGDRLTFVVRTTRAPAALLPAIRTVVSNQAYLFNLRTVDQLAAESVAAPRFRSWLVSLFAGLALALASLGIYGVQGYAVTRRTREIGIRMAVGARPAAVLAMILGESAACTLAGVGVGLVAGLATTRLISGLLFGVSRLDPVTLILSPLILLASALAASYLPARRAMRVDPIVALRCD